MTQASNTSGSLSRASTAAALNYAWNAGVFRADDVIEFAGLTRSTTISAIDTLIHAGLIRELPNTRTDHSYRFGRPARQFELNEQAGVLIGVDAGRSSITTTLTDLRGNVLGNLRQELDSTDDHPLGRRVAVSEAITHALRESSLSDDDVVALTIGVPAPVDSAGNSPMHAEGFWQTMNPGFKDYFATQFPIVHVENDGALAALAEQARGSMRECPNFVAILAGKRLGTGVVLDGKLVYGAHGGVGELASLKYVKGLEENTGLIDLIDVWIREAIDAREISPLHPLARISSNELTTNLQLSFLRTHDPALRPVVERAGAFLARMCEVFSGFYDPEYVLICGGIAESISDVVEHAEQLLQGRKHLPPPRIVASTLGTDVVSIGAVASARMAAQEGILALRSMDDA